MRSVRPAVVIGALTAAGLAAFALYSHRYWNVVVSGADQAVTVARGVLNGTATHGYFDALTDWSMGAVGDLGYKLAGMLVSPGRGLLIGAPFLLLLLPGLRRAWRAAPHWVRSAAVGIGVAGMTLFRGYRRAGRPAYSASPTSEPSA